ncbi:hypothetical protein [Profundibacter sp.]
MTKDQENALKIATLEERVLGNQERIRKLEANQRWLVASILAVLIRLVADFVVRGGV